MKKSTGLGVSEQEKKAWGQGEYANMPQDVVKELYPKVSMASDRLDDTITGIDSCMRNSEGKRSKYVSDQH